MKPYGERSILSFKDEMIMADTISKEKRHEVMSKIRSKDTQIEIKVRHWLYQHGIRYRKNCKDIPGRPDIAIKKYKIAIFIHGCFWHGHENCKISHVPKTRVEYWQAKINKNIHRDQSIIHKLHNLGWSTFVIWECQIESDFEVTMDNLLKDILAIIEKQSERNKQM